MEEIIISLLVGPDVRPDILAILPGHLVTKDAERWIIENIISIAGNDVLTYDVCNSIAKSKCKDDNLKTIVDNKLAESFREIMIRQSEGNPVYSPELSINLAKEIVRKTAIHSLLVSATIQMNEGKSSVDVFKSLSEGLAAEGGKFHDGNEYEIYVIDKEIAARQERRQEEIKKGKVFRFRDQAINNMLPYGLRGGEMLGVTADTGAGKSLSSDNWAIEAFLQGLNVLVVKTENEEIQTAARLDSIFSETPYSRIFKGELNDDEIDEIDARYHAVSAKYGNHLYLSQVIPFAFDVNTIRRILNEIEKTSGRKIDLLIVDSPEHQKSVEKQKSFFESKAAPYWELKTLVKEENLIFISTIQRKVDPSTLFQKKSRKKDEDGEEHFELPNAMQAAGSAEIPRILDYMFTLLAPSKRDQLLGGLKLCMTKGRGSELSTDVLFVKRDKHTLKQIIDEYDKVKISRPNYNEDGTYVISEEELLAIGKTGFSSSPDEDDFDDLSFDHD